MRFNNHYDLIGRHAFLSPSYYHWVNYSPDKLKERFLSEKAKERGTELHELASKCIKNNIKLAKSSNALNRFVNDSIGYKMESEQPLYYSDICFGTADSICFRRNKLMIFDLKTGATPANILQLEIYAALFCLEYGMDPSTIQIELRIYQGCDIQIEEPDYSTIVDIMDIIIKYDKIVREMIEEN